MRLKKSFFTLLAAAVFSLSAAAGDYVTKAGGEWAELPVTTEITKGGILDFSGFNNDAPAGKHGRLVVNKKTGHWEFEKKPGHPVRLIGCNLVYGGNYLSKEDADRIAERFQMMGYNSIRIHHYDVDLIHGNWNANDSANIDPRQLDKLDYLFAALKKRGMYITIDLLSSRPFGVNEFPASYKIKDRWCMQHVMPVIPEAVPVMAKLGLKLLNHVNPYTNLTWNDDPALITICPTNEDTVYSRWYHGQSRPLYEAGFRKWLKEKNHEDLLGDVKADKEKQKLKDQLLVQYLMQVKVESNARVAKHLHENGVKALLTADNWYDSMMQAWCRSELDFVDNHGYHDHPNGWPEQWWNQNSALAQGNRRYVQPVLKMPTRIFGKPFTISEWNYCNPNKFRCEGGAIMGAYAALQDWDGIYRFAWSHSTQNVSGQAAPQGFDIATDPLNMLAERQTVLLFGRGDVAPAKKRFVYATTLADASREGAVDMWAKGLFGQTFNTMGFVSQIGSLWTEGGKKIEGRFDGVIAPEEPAGLNGNPYVATKDLPLPGYGKANGKEPLVSDTGEITYDVAARTFKVVTPKTECLVGVAGKPIEGKNLAVRDSTFFSSVSASAMDGKNLDASRKVLIFHLTNVQGTDTVFKDPGMGKYVYGRNKKPVYGRLPYLVHKGEVTVSVKNSNPGLKVYALDFAGNRGAEVKAEYTDGAYVFRAETVPAGGAPARMIYELGK